LIAGVELCKYLVAKYQIKAKNIVGHSDIAYDKQTGCLNRKQDPSHLFDWKFLAQNDLGVFPQVLAPKTKLFELGNRNIKIAQTKKSLQNFGYRVINLNDEFDLEMQALALVFNRRFLGENLDFWCELSQKVLDRLVRFC
jgi:N-acetylmuramoyl-L-alanine amidase